MTARDYYATMSVEEVLEATGLTSDSTFAEIERAATSEVVDAEIDAEVDLDVNDVEQYLLDAVDEQARRERSEA